MRAPYTGGAGSAGSDIFYVDGDHTVITASSAPEISFPFKGDSIFSNRAIYYKVFPGGASPFYYAAFPPGYYPNIQGWQPNQQAFLIRQKFRVAMAHYRPLSLNTPYWNGWRPDPLGWQSQLQNGVIIPDLSDAILVEEGPPIAVDGGFVEVARVFATLPGTRNQSESFSYKFIGLERLRPTPESRTVQSRVQYDYFVFDDLDILGWSLFDQDSGRRLNATTGLYPDGIILEEQRYYAGETVFGDNFATETDILKDGDPIVPPVYFATVPSLTEYLSFIRSHAFGGAVELVAESSVLRQWMGNIYERATRFVLAQ